jgi:hypothetical protein
MSVKNAALVLLCFLTSGCCQVFSKEDKQPDRPNVTSSWRERTDFGVTSIGFFVMNKDEAIDNGRLGVRVIDILPQQCECMRCEPTRPRVRLAFYQPSDNKVLCEGLFFAGSARLDVRPHCDPSIEASVIYINAINTREKWVSFDLRK